MFNSVSGFEEDLNRLKWWTLCTPLLKPVRGDWWTTRALTRLAGMRAGGAWAWCGRTVGPSLALQARFWWRCMGMERSDGRSIASTASTILARAGLWNLCTTEILLKIARQSGFWGASWCDCSLPTTTSATSLPETSCLPSAILRQKKYTRQRLFAKCQKKYIQQRESLPSVQI